MIKGFYATLLLEFGEISGHLISKGYFRDLPVDDVLELLEKADVLFDELIKDPSFSRKRSDIVQYRRDEQTLKINLASMASKLPTYILKGGDKTDFIDKLKLWNDTLYELESRHLFSTLSEDSPSKLFPNELVSKCGLQDFKDILDGAWCIVYGYPTPAAMILFRAAERESRKYYKRVTGLNPPEHWYDLIEDMRNKKTAPTSILNYMDFIRTKRNEAEHPEKRYTQEEAESIMQQLSFLLNEVYK